MHRYDYSRITFLIGFVVGPLFELSVRQSLIITHSDPVRLLQHPVALLLVAFAAVVAVLLSRAPRQAAEPVRPKIRKLRLGLDAAGLFHHLAPAIHVLLDELQHAVAAAILFPGDGAADLGKPAFCTRGCSSETATASRSLARISGGTPFGA